MFPGSNYLALADWIVQGSRQPSTSNSQYENDSSRLKSDNSHDLIVVYNSTDKKWDVQQYKQSQHEGFIASTSVPALGHGQVVFIRGFMSPAWVSAIGSKYNVDPEFFRRHMEFLSTSVDRHAYSFPTLASCSTNIFRLCVNTLLHRDDFSRQDIQAQRSEHTSDMGKYKIQQLSSDKVGCGDSIVREYSTTCSAFSVIEQWISLYVTRTDSGWTGKGPGKLNLWFN